MTTGIIGLQTHIWNNQIKSIVLLFFFPLLLAGMLFAFFALTGMGLDMGARPYQNPGYDAWAAGWQGIARYGYWALIATFIWFSVAWVAQGALIRMATGAKSVERADAPKIYNMVENLCISRGMKTPKLQIIDAPMLNAFASGVTEETYTITLTRGIIDALDDAELQAVIGHELSHIRHKDVRLLITAVIFVGIISFLSEMTYRMMIYGGTYGAGRRRGGQDGRLLIIAFAILAVGYGLAIILRLALSRRREYLADAGSVELTKDPDAMIRALRKISGRAEMPGVPGEVRQMCIENASGFLGGLFSTHPPIEKRIEVLVAVGGRDVPLTAPPAPEPHPLAEPLQQKPGAWQRPHGPWG